jgi:twitching motility protein PilT
VQTSDLLRMAVAQGASDLHLVPGSIPLARIDGHLIPMPNLPHFLPEACVELVCQVLNKDQRARLERELVLDFSLELDQSRFRGNVCFQRAGMEAIFRVIPMQIPTPESLLLPTSVMKVAEFPRGLVLVTGATGTGKSTTMACILDLINQNRNGNIITIEDPIEFIFPSKRCVVSQREIGLHTPNFASALKFVLRQDPDVVMLGEMRDLETISAALTVAETGHLVIATLHSPDAAQAVDRIIDVFPSNQQQQIRTQLAGVLKAVIAQTLLPCANGKGRVAAREVMHVNSAIASLIRQAKTHEIGSAIDMGFRDGMISMHRAIADLQRKGLVSSTDAHSKARGGIEVKDLRRRGADWTGTGEAA